MNKIREILAIGFYVWLVVVALAAFYLVPPLIGAHFIIKFW